ncbi:unnamed protein product [Parajaminaea phylloscopi]
MERRVEDSETDAALWEQENVHSVYSSIASHFSATRYKPWPLVTSFLASLPAGSVGVDVGCGNGKYLHLRNLLHSQGEISGDASGSSQAVNVVPESALDCLTIGVDRSAELLEFAHSCSLQTMSQGSQARPQPQTSKQARDDTQRTPPIRNEVLVGDGLTTGFRSRAFDYAISIATIHHFSTRSRRREAIRELIRLTQPQRRDTSAQHEAMQESRLSGTGRGRFLVYVWALEQRGQERRKFDEQDAQDSSGETTASQSTNTSPQIAQGRDVLVPWVRKVPNKAADTSGVRDGGLDSEQTPVIDEAASNAKEEDKVFQRYYHLFEATELDTLVDEAVKELPPSMSETETASGHRLRLVVSREDSGWERGNWWGIWRCTWEDADGQ